MNVSQVHQVIIADSVSSRDNAKLYRLLPPARLLLQSPNRAVPPRLVSLSQCGRPASIPTFITPNRRRLLLWK